MFKIPGRASMLALLRSLTGKGRSPFSRGILQPLFRTGSSGGEDSNQAGWIETFAVTFLATALAGLVHPDDPFLLKEAFPWLLIAPLFLALRHGFSFGFTSALFIIAMIIVAWRFDLAGVDDFPATIVLGSLVVTMLAGEFSDLWQRRLGKMEIESEHRDRRMEEFTRSYHLLKVSHDQLVEQLAGSSVSLRQAIAAVREEMLEVSEGSDPLAAEAETILALFRRYGSVQSASLHRVTKDQLDIQPLARLGAVPEDVDALQKSSIVAESLHSGEMISVLAAENGSPRYVDGNILAVAPIRDLSGDTRAALVIYRIPFLKFNDDNLSLIAVMASYLGDLLHEMENERKSDAGTRVDFLAELTRSIEYARRFRMNARLVTIELASNEGLEDLLGLRRSLDKVWVRYTRAGKPLLLWLMPFTDDYGVAGYQARITLWAQQRFASEFGENFVNFNVFPVTGSHNVATILDKVSHACDLVDS